MKINVNKEIIQQERAKRNFKNFISYTMPDYEFNWHHKFMIDKLERFAKGEIKRLMIFMPPRHGKSQLVSRHLPSYILGKNPDAKIIACSYSAELASAMNRDVQRIIDSESYANVFPDTQLGNGTTGLRNSTKFEIPNSKGYYSCAGVGGGITGLGADYAIIDDPIKNADEAASETIRQRQWEWYTSTFYTRLEKGASVLITLTRWNEDDLAGRLLALQEKDPEADKWEIIVFPAIKEDDSDPNDKRAIGEPLWKNKYDVKRLNGIKSTVGSRVWNALYQQRPAPLEGGIIKRKWFKWYNLREMNLKRFVVNFYIDTAYTDSKKNDATAIIAFTYLKNELYIINCTAVRKEFPELIKFIPTYTKQYGYTKRSRIWIEPKASGLSVIQTLKRQTGLNIVQDKPPTESKFVRVNAVTAVIEAGRVLLPEDEIWTDSFLYECSTFPNGKHDDKVDCLVGAINKGMLVAKKRGIRRRN